MSRHRPPRSQRSISARLATRLAWLGLAGMVLLGLAVGSVGAYRLSVQLERRALERQEVSMRVAWAVLEAAGRPFRVADGVMLAGERPLNGDQEVIDRIHALVGGTATVFLGDRRIATNVPGPDGGPALGTRLAPGPVHDAVLRDGRPWRGEADILGQAYLTAYDPIRDTEGRVIGVLYVGVPRAAFFAAMEELILDIATVSLLAGAALAGLIAWLGYACPGAAAAAADAGDRGGDGAAGA